MKYVLLVVLCLATVAAAQPAGSGARSDREKLETVIIGKYSNELNLTPEQAEQFFPRFRQFQNEVEEAQRVQMARRQELDELSMNPNADPGRVNALLAQQTQDAQHMADLKGAFLRDVQAFLTPQQVSRCSILMEEIPRRVHQYIDEQRRERAGDRRQAPGMTRERTRERGKERSKSPAPITTAPQQKKRVN